MYSIEVTGMVEYDKRCRDWCLLPYPDHPKGCPNYGKQARCPPTVSLVHEVMDLDRRMWFIVHEFDLEDHRKRMLEKHPKWSNRQANCVLYWQSRERKRLREYCTQFISEHNGTIFDLCPEAKGVNVFKILRKKGVPIKARPSKIVYMVAMVGFVNNKTGQQSLMRYAKRGDG